MDSESLDESLDSIPQPEYEAFETRSNEPTPTHTDNGHNLKETSLANAEIVGQQESIAATGIDEIVTEVEQDSDDEEEEREQEEEVEVKEQEFLNEFQQEQLINLTESNTNVEAFKVKLAKSCNEKNDMFKTELDSGQQLSGMKSISAAPVPIKIIAATSTPKLLPAKTKNNKLVMVQLVDENGKAFMPTKTAVTVSATAATADLEEDGKFTSSSMDEKSAQQQAAARNLRSSTPLSREILALQKSVFESKILSEFVTDITAVKERKLRKAGGNATLKDTTAEQALSKVVTNNILVEAEPISVRRCSPNDSKCDQSSMQDFATDKRLYHSEENLTKLDEYAPFLYQGCITSLSQQLSTEKSRKSSKFVPLKDDTSNSDYNDAKSRGRSRSKSVHRQSLNNSDSDTKSGKRSRSKSVNRKSPIENMLIRKWPSDEKIPKRTNMRSQNSEFVQKQMDFLNRVMHQPDDDVSMSEAECDFERDSVLDDADEGDNSNVVEDYQTTVLGRRRANDTLRRSHSSSIAEQAAIVEVNVDGGNVSGNVSAANVDVDCLDTRLEIIWHPAPKRDWDSFCWKCRECENLIPCSKCLRCFHANCIKITAATKLDTSWMCPECTTVENVLNGPKRTRRNELSVDLLSQLLSFALKRMKNVKGCTAFLSNDEYLANYSRYIVHPVTFNTLQEKIEKKVFRCAEEFVNETKWILHNSLILSMGGTNNKDTLTSKAILKICRQEANEIDTCAECYLNANTRADWFVDVCAQPHLLLWAKLKGFPYWPAKAMGPGQGSHVNVRFFGEHDRAFVPVKDCFLYSEQDPNTQTGKRSQRELADCNKEVEVHIEKIRSKIGSFKYANYKTPYEPAEELQQLEQMMPGVTEYMRRQQPLAPKPSLQYKIVKTADNHLSIIKKAITPESGNDSDHSSNPSKKLLCESTETEAANKVTVATTKYEVVTKATSDDSNSSKVSTVILKRKSDGSGNNEHKKNHEDAEIAMPKMTKVDVINEDEEQQRVLSNSKLSSKRKHGTAEIADTVDSHRAKHAKHDPKVPLLTIKTNANKPMAGAELKEPTENVAKSVVENLVKNKQGVTIKKITKTDAKKVNANESVDKIRLEGAGGDVAVALIKSLKGANEQMTSNENTTAKHKQDKTTKMATKSAASEIPVTVTETTATTTATTTKATTNIVKDLVPFVEIKEEVVSDNEGEVENKVEQSIAKTTAATTLQTGTTALAQPIPPTTQIPQNNIVELAPLLSTVKQEIMSDDEDLQPAKEFLSATQIATVQEKMNSNKNSGNATAIEAVRVVGDTTIQRISAKIATQPNVNAMTAVNTPAATAQTTNAGKRSGMRGVPYGPLPASATTAVKIPTCSTSHSTSTTTTTNINSNTSTNSIANANSNLNINLQNLSTQQQQLHQNQRARKSFPNRSPPGVSPVRTANTNSAAAVANSATTNALLTGVAAASALAADSKRSFLKSTSMVSIPVDVANNRSNSNILNSSTNSIPVPPLTAVSKTVPTSSSAITTVASNTINVTTASFANCNGGVHTSTAGSTALLTPLTMSAPPPLAGLSQSSQTVVSSASLASGSALLNSNSLTENLNVTVAPAVPVTADAHLLGDFVTPTLASAITDMICRTTPKMTPRPSGPLRSDGSVMFPSHAGPVCHTLVENAHKLTDFFISVMEDTMCEMSVGEQPVLQAKITLLTMELERTKQNYDHEIAELKRTSDLMLCEMRKSMENEKTRLANEIRKQCELERLRSVEETKKKQWCANCGREAQFYCCWNTSYCDYPCQQLHWSRHAVSCAQTRPNSSNDSTTTTATTTATPSPATTTVIATCGVNNQQEVSKRPHGNKASASIGCTVTGASSGSGSHYSKATHGSSNAIGSSSTNNSTSSSSHKKEKNISSKNTTSTTLQALNVTPAAELLKLPSNTYLRAVPNSGSNVRTSACIQRYNIPLPITAPVNAGPNFTIVQRGSNWELMSTSLANQTAAQTMHANATVAAAAPSMTTVTQTSQQRLMSSAMTAKSGGGNSASASGTGGRNRGSNATAATLPINATSLQYNIRAATQM